MGYDEQSGYDQRKLAEKTAKAAADDLDRREGLPPLWLQVILAIVAGAVALLLGIAVEKGWDPMVAEAGLPLPTGNIFSDFPWSVAIMFATWALVWVGTWRGLVRVWRNITGWSPDQD